MHLYMVCSPGSTPLSSSISTYAPGRSSSAEVETALINSRTERKYRVVLDMSWRWLVLGGVGGRLVYVVGFYWWGMHKFDAMIEPLLVITLVAQYVLLAFVFRRETCGCIFHIC